MDAAIGAPTLHAAETRFVEEGHAEVVARALESPGVKKQMDAMAFVPAPTTPEEYDKILKAQLVTFERVARQAGSKAK